MNMEKHGGMMSKVFLFIHASDFLHVVKCYNMGPVPLLPL
jgi:hypothetical protein